jgi:hypothetical protein
LKRVTPLFALSNDHEGVAWLGRAAAMAAMQRGRRAGTTAVSDMISPLESILLMAYDVLLRGVADFAVIFSWTNCGNVV